MDEFARLRTGWAFIIALAVFTIVFAALALPSLPGGRPIEEGWTSAEAPASAIGLPAVPVSLPHALFVKAESEMIFRVRVDPQAGDWLFVPRPLTQYLLVSWNGRPLLELSDRSAPTGNLWNHTHAIKLPDDAPGDLEIVVKGSNNLGLSRPPFLSSSRGLRLRLGAGNYLNHEMILVGIGALAAFAFLLLLRATVRGRTLSADLLIGLACLAGSCYLFDYTFYVSTGSSQAFFLIKKFVFSLGHVSALLSALGTEKLISGRLRGTRVLIPPTILSVAFFIVCWDSYAFWFGLRIANAFLLADFGYLIFLMLKQDKRGLGLHIPGFFLAFSIIQLLSIMFFNFPFPYVMQMAVVINGLSIGAVILRESFPRRRVDPETDEPELRDPLTGLLNRFWVERSNIRGPGAACVVSIAKFEAYKSLQGQRAGERLLIQLSDILKSGLRKSDRSVRLEGGRFAVVMENLDPEAAREAMERVKSIFAKHSPSPNLALEFALASIEETLESSIARAASSLDGQARPAGG